MRTPVLATAMMFAFIVWAHGVPETTFEEDHFKILTFLLHSAQPQRVPK